MTLGWDAAMVAAEDQISCDLSGESVILNLKTGIYYGLNPVGARIWQLLQKPRTIREVRDLVTAEYDVDSVDCERDLVKLLDDMVSRRLIRIADAAGELQTK